MLHVDLFSLMRYDFIHIDVFFYYYYLFFKLNLAFPSDTFSSSAIS